MNHFLEQYDITLRTEGPIFIGSGEKLMKNQAIFEKNKVFVYDIKSLFAWAEEKNKLGDLEEILSDPKGDLWYLFKHGPRPPHSHCLDVCETLNKNKNIDLFIKDAYGNPYVPGSSLKGSIRAGILKEMVKQHPETFNRDRQMLEQDLQNRKYVRAISSRGLESTAFFQLARPKTRDTAIVNDVFSCIRISDSKPLEKTDLLVTYNEIKNKKRPQAPSLKVYRECLKEDLTISFQLTVDYSQNLNLFPRKEGFIAFFEEAISNSFEEIQSISQYPLSQRGNYLYLGGSAGFLTKTVFYELFDNNPPRQSSIKTSRSIKTTKIAHQRKQFGLCHVEINKKPIP